MDSITQATLGAAVGYLCWHQKLKRKALIAGAILGTLPDLDIVIYPLLDEVQRLYWHRGESHSVFFYCWDHWGLAGSCPAITAQKRLKVLWRRQVFFLS